MIKTGNLQFCLSFEQILLLNCSIKIFFFFFDITTFKKLQKNQIDFLNCFLNYFLRVVIMKAFTRKLCIFLKNQSTSQRTLLLLYVSKHRFCKLNSRTLRIKNAKFSGWYFYMNKNIQGDFQICIRVPSADASLNICSVFLRLCENSKNVILCAK